MIIDIKVTPNAKENKVIKESDNLYRVRVTSSPEKGKANQQILSLLAQYFHVSKSRLMIVSGTTSRNKRIEIDL